MKDRKLITYLKQPCICCPRDLVEYWAAFPNAGFARPDRQLSSQASGNANLILDSAREGFFQFSLRIPNQQYNSPERRIKGG